MDAKQPSISTQFAKTKVICVGRYLIDIPESATLAYGRMHVPFETVRLAGKGNDMANIIALHSQMLDKRRNEARRELREDDSLLGKVIQGHSPNQKLLFDLSKLAPDKYSLKAYVSVGPDLYVIFGDSYASKTTVMGSVAELLKAADRIKPMKAGEIPEQPGFCINGAIVDDADNTKAERVELGIRFENHPDVRFSMEMVRKTRAVHSDALEPRLKEAEKDAFSKGMGEWYSKIVQFRRGSRKLGPWEGFEALAWLPPFEDNVGVHQFNFVALGEPNNSYVPMVDFMLDTGVMKNTRASVKPSISDEEALFVWEKLLSSLRVRPLKTGGGEKSRSQ